MADEELFEPTVDNYRVGNRIKDITDGTLYRSRYRAAKEKLNLTEDELLVSLVLNMDGVKVQENPGQSAWPVFATVAGIPSARRFFGDKILNLALWSGEGKPPAAVMLKFIQHEINDINQSSCLISRSRSVLLHA